MSASLKISKLSNPTAEISVVIPAYNAADTITAAVESIFAQTLLPQEIIVVDDGSTDNTAAVVKNLKGSVPVRYVFQKNQRQAAARNNGVAHAQFQWIAFLDADDYWLPEKTALQMAELEQHPECDGVVGNYDIVEDGRVTHYVPDVLPVPRYEAVTLLTTNFFWLTSIILKKTAFEALGGFDTKWSHAEDVEFGWRFCKKYKLCDVQTVVAEYRRRDFSSSNQESLDIAALLAFYKEILEKPDLDTEERETAEFKLHFWQQRHRLFLVRQAAVTKGQLAGLAAYFKHAAGRVLNVKSFGLFALLLIPGSIAYLTKTRWKQLDYSS